MILADTIIRIYCEHDHPRFHVGEFALDKADMSDIHIAAAVQIRDTLTDEQQRQVDEVIEFHRNEPPLWVFAEEFGKVSRGKRTRSTRQRIGAGGRVITDKNLVSFGADGAIIGNTDLLGEVLYHRYKLVCDRCRFTYQRREEHLHVILDRLAAAGVCEISLRELAKIQKV